MGEVGGGLTCIPKYENKRDKLGSSRLSIKWATLALSLDPGSGFPPKVPASLTVHTSALVNTGWVQTQSQQTLEHWPYLAVDTVEAHNPTQPLSTGQKTTTSSTQKPDTVSASHCLLTSDICRRLKHFIMRRGISLRFRRNF